MDKIDKRTRTRITNLMRRDLKKTHIASEAKSKSFKGKTVYHCSLCDGYFYTGQSEKNYVKLKDETYPELMRCKEKEFHLDHISPVVPVTTTLHDMTLDEIALRVYCSVDNLAYICATCHKDKSSKEMTQRAENKKKK